MKAAISLWVLVGVALALALPARAAESKAEIKKACIDAAVEGQTFARQGRLIDARKRFGACSEMRCPARIQTDCTLFSEKLVIPKLTVIVTNESGEAVRAVSIKLDGHVEDATAAAGGVEVDPGVHTVEATAPEHGRAEKSVTLTGTATANVVTLVLPSLVQVAPKQPPVARESVRATPRADARSSGPPLATWILGGFGVLGVGAFAVVGAIGKSEASDLRATCAPSCSLDDRSSVETKYAVADGLLIGGVAFLGLATLVWALTPHEPKVSSGPFAVRFSNP